ncbi:MAG: alpha/beta fold hydrolase [Acidobacteria bacterium]|nr:alpha/beta fold hydrolase [Acidobacteriota bacterium]MBV9070561.1 alpha/beta fold hydrolase [Acidobacteriota bacterium]MBV9184790.1 alpha/beta fold hydrolase [Acidobacteriota bacterium]
MRYALMLALIASAAVAQEPPKVTAAPVDKTLHSTLLLPKDTTKPMPIVLLISGSGPTDRNGNSPMLKGKNNALLMVAEGLASNGIASLRYDKRGVGESAGAMVSEADLRFDTYVDDALSWCEQLRKDKRFTAVIIAGHSEGSLIGMLAAKRCNADGFISMSGAGRSAADILRTQLAGKLPPELAAQSDAILKNLEAGRTTENPPPALDAIYRPSVQPYLISWFRYDPAKWIATLTVPVLIVQGTTDLQVTVDDAKRLAAANPKAKLLLIEGMNHVLKEVPDDRDKQIASYSNPDLRLAPEFLVGIVDFVRKVGK